MKYNPLVVKSFFRDSGLPEPDLELKFHPVRKWRFDFAWERWTDGGRKIRIALEVDGGIWIQGGHNRGAQIKSTWEKTNEAACLGWRILHCEPKDLCTVATTLLIARALELAPTPDTGECPL